VQLAGRGGPAHLLDTVAEPRLAALLERILPHNATERVVLHGGGQDELVLTSHGIQFRGLRVFDTQVAHEILTGEKERSLRDTVQHWLPVLQHGLLPSKGSDEMSRFMANNQWLAPRPLPLFALQYAAQDVLCLEPTYKAMLEELDSDQLALALRLSVDKDALRRWRKTRAEEQWRASKAAPAAAADQAHPL
jgi:ribonuclease D